MLRYRFDFVALFYYTLGNIQPKLRSTLKTIQLICVVTYPLLKEYGFECVLQPFINDMNQLRKVIVVFPCTYVHVDVKIVGVFVDIKWQRSSCKRSCLSHAG